MNQRFYAATGFLGDWWVARVTGEGEGATRRKRYPNHSLLLCVPEGQETAEAVADQLNQRIGGDA